MQKREHYIDEVETYVLDRSDKNDQRYNNNGKVRIIDLIMELCDVICENSEIDPVLDLVDLKRW